MVSSVPFQRLDMVYLESNSNLLFSVINGVLDAPINIRKEKKRDAIGSSGEAWGYPP